MVWLRRAVTSSGWGRTGPLLILAIPTSLVEPLKLIAVAVAGEGHWIASTFVIIAAYGLLFVERLFRIVRPKLLTCPWFARLWNWVLLVRGKVIGMFRPS
jgi:hypothetical protein